MATTIDTTKAADRRPLHFTRPADILADVERLAGGGVRSLGNWSPGQVLQHLAIAINCSIDGFPSRAPLPIRLIGRKFLKRRFLTRPMQPGFKLPERAGILPPPTSWEEGLQNIRQALQRLAGEERRAPHPVLGPLSKEERDQLHCRHSELHLSFLVPEQ